MSVEDTIETTEEGDFRVLDGSRTCANCAHAPVCTVLAGIRPMFQSWSAGDSADAEPPIELLDLALICDLYDPVEGADA